MTAQLNFRGNFLHVNYVHPPVPIRDWDWQVTDDNYDGAPDAGWQCHGEGRTEFLAVLDFYETWEIFNDEALCVHRPMFWSDIMLPRSERKCAGS